MEQPREPRQPFGPPIPPPSEYTGNCPQCNTPLKAGTEFCPNCGARVGSPGPSALGVVGTVVLSLLTLVFGGFGACSLLVGASAMAGPADDGFGWFFVIIGLCALVLAALFVRRIIQINRRGR